MRTPGPAWSSDFSLPHSVIVLNPLERPSPRLTVSAAASGAVGVLELPTGDPREVVDLLDRTCRWSSLPFGVRIREGCSVTAGELPERVDTVLLADPARSPAEFTGRRVLTEVTSLAGALSAAEAGATGLIVRGSESGGRAGELSTFVLLQQVLAEPALSLPTWACGGIGPHTAAAAVAGGAAGVVLDTQLALFDEAALPTELTGVLAGLDGSETALHHGVRVLRPRGPGAPELPSDQAEFTTRIGSDDLRTQFVPLGQDAFLAASFAERWTTVAEAVRGIGAAMAAAFADDAPAAALAPGSAGARALGTQLPVAQGPMTRVSDEPAFAAAVAAEGGLPFLALALANADRTRSMLERTRDALGDAKWGVGVLGFADESIKAAQLDVVRELRPTHAIIAGGRPAQAAALEAEGITTFLHVPSPGLLRQFLAAGARRFIFEGAECGGHVGPRNSFPLWEAQTEVLLDFLAEARAQGDEAGDRAAGELTVLFAGGIHDERSSAMAAALAAPLTRAGVAFGVLMGTAYLFTEEAVRGGAIQPLFQRRILDAQRTDLLETAPGHATRCARSAISTDFAALKGELREQGVPDREIWERLERFNVGRLRLASKGIERVGDELLAVDETRQADEGMFMAGEVVVLREAVTTVAALHDAVSEGAAGWLRARASELRAPLGVGRAEERPAPEPLRVAVVGMAGMFPGAPDLADFWANILAGKDCVTEVPAQRWDQERYYAPDGDGERTPSRWGGFLPEIPFDPLRYGIPPASLAAVEPVQLLALEAARRALADAGYDAKGTDHARTSVVFGAEAGSDLSNATTLRTVLPGYIGTIPPALDEQLPRLTEDSFPGMLANVIAGRVANRLDLGGANYTVDAACASSLTAVDVACKELVAGTSDMVLCGGADLHNGINDYLLFSSVHALSPTGRSATFDAAADGIALGEGVACVVLKRLADAERDGDRVYAVIDGVGSASDGRALGLTAPRPEGQHAALTRAYRNAGVSPAEVGLVEAHGTGTVVGDRTELATLTEVFTNAGAEVASCAVGSVKSQIGHTKCAAGLAGLIKVTLALYHGVKPPTLHLKEPNSAWRAESSPFVFHTAAAPWAVEPAERVAGVSAFGFGGTNFHVVLRAYTQAPPAHSLDAWPAELFTFRGRDAEAARRSVRALEDLVRKGGRWKLRDYARSAARRGDRAALRGERVWIAVVADSLAGLPGLLRRAAEGEHAPEAGIHAAEAGTHAAETGSRAAKTGSCAADAGSHAAEGEHTPDAGSHAAEAGTHWPEAGTHAPEAGNHATDAGIHSAETGRHAADGVESAPGAGGACGVDGARGAGVSRTAGGSAGDAGGKLAFLFPGQGSQRPGMLAELFVAFPELQRYLQLGSRWADILHPPAAFGEQGKAGQLARITDTAVAQPALGMVELAAADLLASLGVRPAMAAGHSYGELVALGVAGALSPQDVLTASAERAEAILARTAGGDPGTMAAVTASAEQVEEVLRLAGLNGEVVAANHNSPSQTVISGPTEQVGAAVARLRDAGHSVKPLQVACAFHSPLLAGAGDAFAERLDALTVYPPAFDVWANRTAEPYPRDPAGIRAGLAAQIGSPVRFAEQIESMYAAGARVFAEVGPGRVLSRLVSAVLGDRPHRTIPLDGGRAGGLSGFLTALAQLAVNGADVRTGRLFRGRDAVDPETTVAGRSPGWTVDGQLVRLADGTIPPHALRPAQPVTELIVQNQSPHSPHSAPDALVAEFLRTSRDLVAAQRDVLMTYLGGPGAVTAVEAPAPVAWQPTAVAAPTAPPVLTLPAAVSPTTAAGSSTTTVTTTATTADAQAGPAAVPEAGPADSPTDPESVLAAVLTVVADRTGYPVEMIEPGLDLEADLSVDSIKRAEIAGELAVRLGLPLDASGELDGLSTARTAAGITGLLLERLTGTPDAPTTGDIPKETETSTEPAETTAEAEILAPQRLEFTETPLADVTGTITAGAAVLLLGGGELASVLAGRLRAAGASPTLVPAGELPTATADAVVFLDTLDADQPPLPDALPLFQAALAGAPGAVVAVERRTEGAASGLRGFFRSVAREYADLKATLVEVPAGATTDAVADALVTELASAERESVVLDDGGKRRALRLTPADLGPLAAAGAGPAGAGQAEAEAAGLDHESVVLLVGGARGITARFARTIASASRCRIELMGRTPVPAATEDPATAGAADRDGLRAAFLATGLTSPGEVERLVSAVLAEREVRATVDALRELGSEARYHCVDVLDTEAVRATVKDIYAEHGRLDGVVYAAGVIEDKLLAEKSAESFGRVFSTKVDGARAVLDAVDVLPHGPKFAVLFGSIAAALGNRGQSDYAAANDALEELGRRWSTDERRGLTVHWGPWAAAETNGGMVTPALMRIYAARGIKLIDPEEGPLSLLRELAWGAPQVHAAVYTASGW